MSHGVPTLNHYVASQSLSTPSNTQSPHPLARFVHTIDSFLGAALNTLFIWDRRHRDRLHLASLDERMLRDIGITGADVQHEAAKPFWRA